MVHIYNGDKGCFCGAKHGYYCDPGFTAISEFVRLDNADCPECWMEYLRRHGGYTGVNEFDMRFFRPFLSGPITGVPDAADLFHAAEQDIGSRISLITSISCFVLNPVFIPELIGEGRKHEEYMKVSLSMLETASAIVMLPNWHKSRRARMELAFALRSGRMAIAEWGPRASVVLEAVKGGSNEQ